MSSAICSGWILREIGLPMHCNNCLVTRFTCRKSYILAFDSGRKVFTTQRYTYIRCFGSASAVILECFLSTVKHVITHTTPKLSTKVERLVFERHHRSWHYKPLTESDNWSIESRRFLLILKELHRNQIITQQIPWLKILCTKAAINFGFVAA